MYLIDTDVVVRLRSGREAQADRPLVAWASGVPRQGLFLSAVTVLELERAALHAERRSKGGSAPWRRWIDDHLLPAFESRILAVDAACAARAARLKHASIRDALVAATALQNNLTLVTARPSAFRSGKVKILDPWNCTPDHEVDDWREATRASSPWLKTLFVRG